MVISPLFTTIPLSAENPFAPDAVDVPLTTIFPLFTTIFPVAFTPVGYDGSNPLPDVVRTIFPEFVIVEFPPSKLISPSAFMPFPAFPELLIVSNAVLEILTSLSVLIPFPFSPELVIFIEPQKY